MGFGARGAVFDTDGVLTDTASLHAQAWRRTFDGYLRERAQRLGEEPPRPFDPRRDYLSLIDGRSREDGAAAFLESRGIHLAGPDELRALTDRKDAAFMELLRTQGARPYPSSLDFVRSLRRAGVPTAVVSASRHCREVLESAGAAGLFDVRVDGIDAARLKLPGKPDPALFLEAARRLGTEPGRTLLVEDAIAGVSAGRRGGFHPVVGLDRGAGESALLEAGADRVVEDLAELGEEAAR